MSHRIVAKDRREFVGKLWPKGGVFAEVGVQRGHFSAAIIAECEPKILLLIDAWRHLPGPYEVDPANTTTEQHLQAWDECRRRYHDNPNVSLLRLLSGEAADLIADAALDAAYIDCDHTRPGIEADLLRWWPKVKPGGWLCGHDWLEPGQERPWVDVRPAVQAFAYARSLEVVLSGEEDWKSWGMRKP